MVMAFPVIELARTLVWALQRDLARRRAAGEVRVKRNASGKIVIGIILEPEQPLDVRTGEDPDVMQTISRREHKRRLAESRR